MDLEGIRAEELLKFETGSAPADLERLIAYLRDQLGVKNIVYHSPVMPGRSVVDPYLLLTYSAEWVEHYKAEGYVHVDPVVNLGARSVLPLEWSRLPKLAPKVRKLFGEAREAGVGHNGVTVPVRGPGNGLWAIASFTSDEPDRHWQARRPEIVRDAVLATHFLHQRVVERLAQAPPLLAEALSAREVEALAWAAEGKTTEDIGVIMRISAETAKAHLDSARNKLGAINRPHAVAKAIRAGLIP